jgi:hypothetical protein
MRDAAFRRVPSASKIKRAPVPLGRLRTFRMKPSRCATLPFLLIAVSTLAQVTTSQYDNMRTGATLNEILLTPKNVNAQQFGKLGVFKVDGAVYAEPLFLPSVEVPGKGTHDVIFVATEHDSVYAFDAARPGDPPLWQVRLLDPARENPVSEDQAQCPFIRPEIGITSTPVIDLPTGTLYVLARSVVRHTTSPDEYFQRLHALAITTGVEKFGGPKLITASVPGRGAGRSNREVAFDPLRENPRAALTLANKNVYLTWASSCDVDPYHGWVIAYDPQTLAQKAVLNVNPDGSEAGIWLSDTGPAVDSEGNLYVPTGNGTFDATSGGRDYGDSVLKLDGSSLAVRDYFTPSNQAAILAGDADVGSSGPTLLPDQPGRHRHLLLQPTKDSTIYVIDRDNMGKFHSDRDDLVQIIHLPGPALGAMAYWNGHAYFATSGDYLRSYAVKNGQLIPGEASSVEFRTSGATPSISSDGNKNAIVWAVSTKTWDGPDTTPAVLYAFDATKLGQPLYTSEQNIARDRAGMATRFVIPLVVNGRVYFSARGEVDVYGLLK